MSDTWLIHQTVDLTRCDRLGLRPAPLLSCGDDHGHTWEVTVLNAGDPADLSGWRALGYFTRPDGNTVAVGGEVEGNTARVTLDRAVYALSGAVRARLKLVRSSAEMTLLEASFRVLPGAGEAVFDPTGRLTALPNEMAEAIDALTMQVEALKETRYAPMTAALAETMTDEGRIYVYTGSEAGWASGHWYFYDGTAWTDGGPFNAAPLETDATLSLPGQAADAAAAGRVAEESLALRKAALGDWRPPLSVGGINTDTGANTSSAANRNRARTDPIPRKAGQRVIPEAGTAVMILYYGEDTAFLGAGGVWETEAFPVGECAAFRLLVRAEGVTDFEGLPNRFVRVVEPQSLAERLEGLTAGTAYGELRDRPQSLLPDGFVKFGPATVSGSTATLTAATGGIRPPFFRAASDMVRVDGRLRFTAPSVAAFVQYHDGEGTVQSLRQAVPIADGEDFSFTFDAASLSVYAGASDFTVMFNAPLGSSLPYAGTTITVEKLSVYECGPLQRSACYDPEFGPMMLKTFAALDEARALAGDRSLSLRAPDGRKYALLLGEGGQLLTTPHIPKKALFVGNSLLLGMNRRAADPLYAYGMCARDHTRDWYWQVKAALLAREPEVECRRLFGAPLEQMRSASDLEALWSRTANEFTGAPMGESFTPDLDLIVFQLGDNLNTPERLSAFEGAFDDLMGRMRRASPGARILWVYGWFNHAFTRETLLRLCGRWNIAAVDVHALRTEETQAVQGQSCETADGGQGVVSDGWITHPGDAGMAAIAEAVIRALDL